MGSELPPHPELVNAMGAQNAFSAPQGSVQAAEDLGPAEAPQRAGRRRDRNIDMSGKFRLPAHI
ncbi:MAG TPA: hypothetical protein VH209_04810 [Steroidobacteraceae bacterium]|nr:hypothetical protein [Steroidobacteraceae bacterium]